MPDTHNIHIVHTSDAHADFTKGIHIWTSLLREQKDIFQGNTNYTNFWYNGQKYKAAASFSLEEYQQLQNFKSHKAASLFATSHLMLRLALQKILPQMPRTQSFLIEDKGKPYIPPEYNSKNVHFSLSHAWPVAGVALATQQACGLDVEMSYAGTQWQDLAKNCLQNQETQYISSCSDPASAFIHCWTRKEAAAKALGLGLHWDFASFCICPINNSVLCPQKKERIYVRSVHLSALYPTLDGWLSIACSTDNALAPVYIYPQQNV